MCYGNTLVFTVCVEYCTNRVSESHIQLKSANRLSVHLRVLPKTVMNTCQDRPVTAESDHPTVMQHSQHAVYNAIKGRRFRVIIRIRVEYEQHFIYGRADRKVNDDMTFEQSAFSEIHKL